MLAKAHRSFTKLEAEGQLVALREREARARPRASQTPALVPNSGGDGRCGDVRLCARIRMGLVRFAPSSHAAPFGNSRKWGAIGGYWANAKRQSCTKSLYQFARMRLDCQ